MDVSSDYNTVYVNSNARSRTTWSGGDEEDEMASRPQQLTELLGGLMVCTILELPILDIYKGYAT